jgi:hypothetical protein
MVCELGVVHTSGGVVIHVLAITIVVTEQSEGRHSVGFHIVFYTGFFNLLTYKLLLS